MKESTPQYFRPEITRESGDLHSPAHASHGDLAHHHEAYKPVFTTGSARRKELDEILTRYPTKMAALLPALWICLLYTSDAADERSSVDLGGRRIIKKKKQ